MKWAIIYLIIVAAVLFSVAQSFAQEERVWVATTFTTAAYTLPEDVKPLFDTDSEIEWLSEHTVGAYLTPATAELLKAQPSVQTVVLPVRSVIYLPIVAS